MVIDWRLARACYHRYSTCFGYSMSVSWLLLLAISLVFNDVYETFQSLNSTVTKHDSIKLTIRPSLRRYINGLVNSNYNSISKTNAVVRVAKSHHQSLIEITLCMKPTRFLLVVKILPPLKIDRHGTTRINWFPPSPIKSSALSLGWGPCCRMHKWEAIIMKPGQNSVYAYAEQFCRCFSDSASTSHH